MFLVTHNTIFGIFRKYPINIKIEKKVSFGFRGCEYIKRNNTFKDDLGL